MRSFKQDYRNFLDTPLLVLIIALVILMIESKFGSKCLLVMFAAKLKVITIIGFKLGIQN